MAPFPSRGYAPGVTYGAYPDATGQKFVYVSGYDTFDLQVASEKVSATPYKIQMVDPGSNVIGLPQWERYAFRIPYYNGQSFQDWSDPLAGTTNIHPSFSVGGTDITAALENGTYTTPALGTNQTLNLTVSFAPPAGSQRYIPIKFNLVNANTGEVEDVLVIDPSTVVTCTSDGYEQVQAKAGTNRLNFEAFDRAGFGNSSDCMQHLTHSWITTAPLVFAPYVPATETTPAGGDYPHGLWLVPQGGSVVQVNTDTLTVRGANVSAYVDSPLINPDGSPDTAAAASGLANYYFLGNYPGFTWHTADGTNGIALAANTTVPAAPFPLVTPSTSSWPNNTMGANRYFQVDTLTGTPVMVGEMDVDVPWYNSNLPFIMELDGTSGLLLNYAVPQNTSVSVPGVNGFHFYNFYWNRTTNGKVTQGGCLGVPGEVANVLFGASGAPSLCFLGATVTFEPISSTPGVEAAVSQVTVQLINVGIGVKGSPEFNFNSFTGEIDFDPATETATKVVLDPVFGVGPPTPCQLDQNNGLVSGFLKNVLYLPCPTNYFFFQAKITYQKGGFDNGSPNPNGSGIGLQFSGTLTFLNIINLANVEADISTSPFNFHFGYSPIDLSISDSIPVSAKITLSGDVGALGFDIALSGGIYVDGVSIVSASGILSTKGIGACGDVLGTSMGFGDAWGSSPQIYASGCTTSQFQVQPTTGT